jgi:hypothetical protein
MFGQTEKAEANLKELLEAARDYINSHSIVRQVRLINAIKAFDPTPLDEAMALLIDSGKFVLGGACPESLTLADSRRAVSLIRVKNE